MSRIPSLKAAVLINSLGKETSEVLQINAYVKNVMTCLNANFWWFTLNFSFNWSLDIQIEWSFPGRTKYWSKSVYKTVTNTAFCMASSDIFLNILLHLSNFWIFYIALPSIKLIPGCVSLFQLNKKVKLTTLYNRFWNVKTYPCPLRRSLPSGGTYLPFVTIAAPLCSEICDLEKQAHSTNMAGNAQRLQQANSKIRSKTRGCCTRHYSIQFYFLAVFDIFIHIIVPTCQK